MYIFDLLLPLNDEKNSISILYVLNSIRINGLSRLCMHRED